MNTGKDIKEIKDDVFRNALQGKMEKELKEVGEQLSTFLKKYAFLFENDYERLLDVLKVSFINEYESNTNIFKLNFDSLLDNTPQITKDKLFESIITKVSKDIDINEITEKPKEEPKEESAESKDEPTYEEKIEDVNPEELLEY